MSRSHEADTINLPAPLTFLQSIQLMLVNSGLRLVAACVILVLGWMLATATKRWAVRGLAHLPIDLTLKPLLASLIRYAILIITLILVLGQFGVQTTSLIALLGAAGLAIGLALQGTLSNVASGVMLLVLRPFRVGHFVEVAGKSGTVREIGLFTTLLTTRDLTYVSIPNSAIFGSIVINFTREPLRRVEFRVPVDITNDLSQVQKAIVRALAADSHSVKEPGVSCGVLELQEYAVVMFARAFVPSNDYWRALPSLQKSVKDALDQEQILHPVNRQAAMVRTEPQWPANTPPLPNEPVTGDKPSGIT
ncbi:MAG TPA: mechanosensitive ion channel domain-containing protein [Pyrinomonadaceae bacterium]|nr:mechanosensitive ion channel domain-containing protein [Pyrinomonadaceae bacterium]